MKLRRTICLILAASLTGCHPPSQNNYSERDVGMNAVVEFGTIVSEREVDIAGQNTGLGATAGAIAGAGAGSAVGQGGGTLGAMIAGAVIAGVAGHMAEQALADHKGIEYIITIEKGDTVSIVQNIAKDDVPLKVGQRVMVQTSGSYRRVLPAESLPEKIKRPKKIKFED